MSNLMKINMCSFFILIFIVLICFSTNFVDAQNVSGEKTLYLNDKQLTNETIFTNERVIAPGDKLTKEFYVKNNNDFKCNIKNFIIEGQLRDKEGNVIDNGNPKFNNFMNNSIITISYNGKEISRQNLKDALDINFTEINQIAIDKNETEKFAIEYTLNKDADNSIQGVSYIFNIGINYSSIDGAETVIIDKGVGGVSLVQTGTFLDNKLLTSLGVCFLVIGLIIFFSKDVLNKKIL